MNKIMVMILAVLTCMQSVQAASSRKSDTTKQSQGSVGCCCCSADDVADKTPSDDAVAKRFCEQSLGRCVESEGDDEEVALLKSFDTQVLRELYLSINSPAFQYSEQVALVLLRNGILQQNSLQLLPMWAKLVGERVQPNYNCEWFEGFVQHLVDMCQLNANQRVYTFHLFQIVHHLRDRVIQESDSFDDIFELIKKYNVGLLWIPASDCLDAVKKRFGRVMRDQHIILITAQEFFLDNGVYRHADESHFIIRGETKRLNPFNGSRSV